MLCLASILTAMILALPYSMHLHAVNAITTETHSDMKQSHMRSDGPSDCDAAIEAIERAENLFKLHGYDFSQSVKVQFKKSLSVALHGNSANKQTEGSRIIRICNRVV